MFPYQISYLDMPKSDFIEKAVVKKLGKLETFFNPIMNCKVIFASPHHHSPYHRQYFVELQIYIPGNDTIVVSSANRSKPHKSVYESIHEVFTKAEKVLKRQCERMHKDKSKLERRPHFNSMTEMPETI